MSNGPAGENLLPWACLSTDQYHKAGRGGAGALMGAKNVKSVAVLGTGAVAVGDAHAFMADLRRIHKDYIFTPANMWAHEEGTLALVDMVQAAGAMPTRNWSQGQFEGSERINSRAYMKVRLKKRACSQCAIGCRNFHVIGDARGEGPEFETVAICGANCGIGDAETLFRFNLACDDLGMDTISTGGVVAQAMDMTEKGIADFSMTSTATSPRWHSSPNKRASARSLLSALVSWRPSTATRRSPCRSRTWSCPATTRAAPSA
jgi:aldehyde:ferredoxin oxidoreductase